MQQQNNPFTEESSNEDVDSIATTEEDEEKEQNIHPKSARKVTIQLWLNIFSYPLLIVVIIVPCG